MSEHKTKAKSRRPKVGVRAKSPPTFRRDARLEEALRTFSTIKNQTVAARSAGVSPKRLRKAIRELGFAHREGRGWKITDELIRKMTVTTTGGRRRLDLAGPQTASLVGQHDNAVKLFLQTNNPSVLAAFDRKMITDASGAVHQLETRPNKLYRLGASGEVFEFIYKLTI